MDIGTYYYKSYSPYCAVDNLLRYTGFFILDAAAVNTAVIVRDVPPMKQVTTVDVKSQISEDFINIGCLMGYQKPGSMLSYVVIPEIDKW